MSLDSITRNTDKLFCRNIGSTGRLTYDLTALVVYLTFRKNYPTKPAIGLNPTFQNQESTNISRKYENRIPVLAPLSCRHSRPVLAPPIYLDDLRYSQELASEWGLPP